ncbi:DNA primase [Listeria phage LIS04]|nr:DNA primase [Listeria phage LIS04]
MSGRIEYNKRLIFSVFGETNATANDGKELIYNCPFCEERRGKADTDHKFYVNAKSLRYWCFKCEAKGSLGMNSFVKSILGEGNSDVYGQLFGVYNSILSRDRDLDDDTEEDDNSNTFFIPHKKLSPGSMAYEYMISRKLSPEDIIYYDMREGDLFNARHFGRVVIPNKVIGQVFTDMYVGRAYLGQELRYSNPPKSDRASSVFNLHRIEHNSPITIAEGAISAIFTGRNGVCTYGKYVTPAQLTSILNHKPSALYVALDPDAADQAEKLCHKIISRSDIPTYLVQMPEGMDPADLGYDGFNEYRKSSTRYVSKVYFQLGQLFKI